MPPDTGCVRWAEESEPASSLRCAVPPGFTGATAPGEGLLDLITGAKREDVHRPRSPENECTWTTLVALYRYRSGDVRLNEIDTARLAAASGAADRPLSRVSASSERDWRFEMSRRAGSSHSCPLQTRRAKLARPASQHPNFSRNRETGAQLAFSDTHEQAPVRRPAATPVQQHDGAPHDRAAPRVRRRRPPSLAPNRCTTNSNMCEK